MMRALSSPQRLALFMKLTRCCENEGCCEHTAEGIRRCVGDLAGDLDLAPSTVSHHLRELRLAGMMNIRRQGRNIECWVNMDAVRMLADFFQEAAGQVGRCAVPEQADPVPGVISEGEIK